MDLPGNGLAGDSGFYDTLRPERHWSSLGLTLSADDFTDTEALATVARITDGNSRLVQRLFAQITRVLELNNLRTITREVAQTARKSLVIGIL